MKNKQEQVFVIPARTINQYRRHPASKGTTFSWFSEDIDSLKYACSTSGKFVEREVAEKDESTKQVIPYIAFVHGGKVLAYQRSKKSGEGRLHDKWSIGIGGHINPCDQHKSQEINLLISNTIQREINEELQWDDEKNYSVNNLRELGVIHDNTNSVGRVHLGYALLIDIPPEEADLPKPKEDSIAAAKWTPLEEATSLPNLESWSKILLDAIVYGIHRVIIETDNE